MANVTGTVKGVVDAEILAATIDVSLCGYAFVPRVQNSFLVGRATEKEIEVDGSTGAFQFTVPGNDTIIPAGTYYTVTVRDENGDVIQVNAYVFLGGSNYDLDNIDPYDPTQPPAPLPPQILNLLLVVPYDPNAQFPGDQFTSWQITLAGDCSPSFVNLVNGNLYTIIILQDGAGHHAFNWPSNVHNASSVYPIPNGRTIQTFVAVDGNLYPIGVGTWQ